MIRKYAGEMELVCDKCGQESPSYDDAEFERMIADAKEDKWRVSRIDGHWNHECPACVSEDSALSAARRKFGLR